MMLMPMAFYHYLYAPFARRPLSMIEKGDVIVALSFGQGINKTPGDTNRGLASIINSLYHEARVKPKILAQWEIADILVNSYHINVDYRADIAKTGEYLSTYGVLKQFKSLPLIDKAKRFVLVAQTDHAFRVALLMKRLAYSANIQFGPVRPEQGWGYYHCNSYGYSHRSTQAWTRNRTSFIRHELNILKESS